MTTRGKREGEVDGEDYNFVTKEEFLSMVEAGKFLEYAEVFGNYYGTPKDAVESFLSNGEDVLFEIEWKGHRQVTAMARDDVASVFILPPSMDELIRRLRVRNKDSEEVVRHRMEEANLDISHWHEYDYTIINKNIDETLDKLLWILRAERLKKNRRLGLSAFVGQLMHQTLDI